MKAKLIALIAAAAGAMHAESVLEGRVTDAAGAPAAGTSLTLRHDNGLTLRGSTGEQGAFRFDGLSAGRYTVRISQPGFQVREYRVTVPSNGVAKLDAQFAVSSPARTVQDEDNRPAPDMRRLFRDGLKPKWAHVQLVQWTTPVAADGEEKEPSLFEKAARDAYREQPQLARVFGTVTQTPAAAGYRFRF
ncbi:MAG: carboxypeptidase regulatory-like domain-containing protein [Bryobacterales bacterium]|nr:carboxypeptidase regulatory-like domain-containing protein [Bryobacterales bacterium]